MAPAAAGLRRIPLHRDDDDERQVLPAVVHDDPVTFGWPTHQELDHEDCYPHYVAMRSRCAYVVDGRSAAASDMPAFPRQCLIAENIKIKQYVLRCHTHTRTHM